MAWSQSEYKDVGSFNYNQKESNKFLAVRSALIQDNFIGNTVDKAIDWGIAQQYDWDDTYRSEDNIRKIRLALDEEDIDPIHKVDILANARNEEHYSIMLQEARRKTRDARYLDSLGIEGILYRASSGIADMGVPFGIMKALPTLANKGIKAGQFLGTRLGLSAKASEYVTKIAGGVALEATLEAPKQVYSQRERDEVDMALAMLAGGVGGALYQPKMFNSEVADTVNTVLRNGLDEAGSTQFIALHTGDFKWGERPDDFDAFYGGVLGDEGTYLDTTGRWLAGEEGLTLINKPYTHVVKSNLSKPLVITEKNAVDISNKFFKEGLAIDEIISNIRKEGYDGIITKFDEVYNKSGIDLKTGRFKQAFKIKGQDLDTNTDLLYSGEVSESFSDILQSQALVFDKDKMELLETIDPKQFLKDGEVMSNQDDAEKVSKRIQDFLKSKQVTTEELQQQAIKQAHKNTLEHFQVDQVSYFETSASQTMKGFMEGSEDKAPLLFNGANKTAEGFSSAEYTATFSDKVRGLFTRNYLPLYHEYYKTLKTRVPSRFNLKAQRDFNEFIGKVHYGLVDEMSLPEDMRPLYSKAKQLISTMSEGSHDIARQLGHSKFVGDTPMVAKRSDYLPIDYRLNKVASDINLKNITETDYRNLIRESMRTSLERAGAVIDEERLKFVSNKWVDNQFDRMNHKKNLSFEDQIQLDNRMDSFEATLNELLDELGENTTPIRDAIDTAKQRTKQAKKPKETTGRMARRFEIDMQTAVTTEAGGVIRLADYVELDVQKLWDKYAVTVGGDLGLQKAGIKSRDDILNIRKQIEQELREAQGLKVGELDSKSKQYLANYDDVMKQFLGMPTATNPSGLPNRAVTVANRIVRATKLGMAWLPMMVEGTLITSRAGSKSMLKSLPEVNNILKGYDGNVDEMSNMVLEARIQTGLGEHMYHLPNNALYDDLHTTLESPQNFLEKGLDKLDDWATIGEEATFQMGGIKSLTGLFEQMFNTALNKNMLDTLKNSSSFTDDFIKEVGWNREIADKIANNMSRHVNTKANFEEDFFNFKDWDEEALNAYVLGSRRYSASTVQRNIIGDAEGFGYGGELLKNSPTGRLILNLKGYILAAHRKQLTRAIKNFDMKTVSELIATTATGAMIYTARQHYTYADDWDKLQEKTTPEAIMLGAFAYTNYSALIPDVVDEAWSMVSGEGLFQQRARGITIPIGQTLSDIKNVIPTVAGLALDNVTTTENDIRRTLGLIVPNFFGTQAIKDSIAESLGEE